MIIKGLLRNGFKFVLSYILECLQVKERREMEPIIGIPGNSMFIQSDAFPDPLKINYSPRDISKAVSEAGGLPVIIPVGEPEHLQKYVEMIDGLILAGGQDISPHLYGEDPREGIKATSPKRDAAEVALTEAYISTGKPILGICRGLQLINAMFGGTLYQDLSESDEIFIKHVQETPTHHPIHRVKIDSKSYLGSILPEEIKVNSLHHQVIRKLGSGLKTTAIAGDGVIEAIETVDPTKNIVAVQWHPESTYYKDPHSLALFEDLVKRAQNYEN